MSARRPPLAPVCALLLAWAVPGRAEVPSELAGRRIARVEIESTARVRDVSGEAVTGEQLVRMASPLRQGAELSPELVRNALVNLYARQWFTRVGATVEAGPDGVVVKVQVEPRQSLVELSVRGVTVIDEALQKRALDLPSGTAFSPARLDEAARRLARALFREGRRDAVVGWSVEPRGDDLSVRFDVEEGPPTTLVQLEFEGTDGLGLHESELGAAFDLDENAPVSLTVLEKGVEALRELYRKRGFYRAKVAPPVVQAAGGRAVVRVSVEPGPHFTLQFRGNRTFDDQVLLDQLRYTGAEPLDENAQAVLASKIKLFYELAGFPNAKVSPREAAPARDAGAAGEQRTGGCGGEGRVVRYVARGGGKAPDPEEGLVLIGRGGRAKPFRGDDEFVPAFRPPAAVLPSDPSPLSLTARPCLVTFAVLEGTPVRVVERAYPGATVFSYEELDRRVDALLEDAQPLVLLEDREKARHSRARLSGVPGEDRQAPSQRQATEVYSERVWHAAAEQITQLYRAQGYLEARVGGEDKKAELQRIDEDVARVVLRIEEGRQTTVSSVTFNETGVLTEAEVQELIPFKAGDAFNEVAVDDARAAIELALRRAGHLFARVEEEVEQAEGTATAKIAFRIEPGDQVRVERIRFEGLNARTDENYLRERIGLEPDDLLTPESVDDASRALGTTGMFSSVAVRLGETAADESIPSRTKPLIVIAREKPTLTWEVRGGASAVDGPRLAAQAALNNAFGRGQTLSLSGKVNYPFWRLGDDAKVCASCVPADLVDQIERRVYLGFAWPGLLGLLGNANLRIDGVHENVIRPAYRLSKFALVASSDGYRLVLPTVAGFPLGELTALVQGEVEFDNYEARRGLGSAIGVSLADRQASLLPEGSLVLGSLRPTVTWDARDDRVNATKGFAASLALDFSRSLDARTPTGGTFTVSLVRVLATTNVYVPGPEIAGRRAILMLGGRFGTMLRDPDTYVVGTKRFFVGGVQTLRGFNEDGVYAQDVRAGLRDAVARCAALVSGAGCGPGIAAISQGHLSAPEGGTLLVSLRAELRLPVSASLDLSTFADFGNVWVDPSTASLDQLRLGLGGGLRALTPIGALAVEVGVNPWADPVVLEPVARLHFSLGVF